MKRILLSIFGPVFLGLSFVILLIAVAAAAPPAPGPPGIQINGIFWGDGDYTDYVFLSESEPDNRGYVYAKAISPTQAAVLVRLSYAVNDNAFQRIADGYVQSVGWDEALGAEESEHQLKHLLGSDELTVFIECGAGKYQWSQDLLDGDMDVHDWASPIKNFVVLSGTIPTGGPVVIEAHSSTEYNLLNSSWISVNQIISASLTNADDWMSPDLPPMGTISITVPPTDVNAMTQLHEDYPFFMSTGPAASDFWEWEVSYEMLLDTSVCAGTPIYVGVSFAHNSPSKAPPRDIFIPTAIQFEEISVVGRSQSGLLVLVAAGGLVLLSVLTVVVSRRKKRGES